MIQTTIVGMGYVNRDNGHAVHRGRVVARVEPLWYLCESEDGETLLLVSVEQMSGWTFHLDDEVMP